MPNPLLVEQIAAALGTRRDFVEKDWEQDYLAFVQNVSFASEEENISYRKGLGALRNLVKLSFDDAL